MAGNKLIKIKSDSNDALKKLLYDLNIAETINEKQAERNEKWTPERWYHEIKKRWYFHSRSWYMLEAISPRPFTPEEMKATCNGFTGCVPGCRFYEPEGRITEAELQRVMYYMAKLVELKKQPCSKEHQQQEEEWKEQKKQNEQ